LVGNGGVTAFRLNQLKAMGVRLAIDDFGTGYASLAYLQQFPVDILKIDRSFIDAIGSQPAAAAIIRSLVDLGQALRLETLAEAIEQYEQVDQLIRHGCRDGQGFYYARAMASE